jgi:hypothetical protein
MGAGPFDPDRFDRMRGFATLRREPTAHVRSTMSIPHQLRDVLCVRRRNGAPPLCGAAGMCVSVAACRRDHGPDVPPSPLTRIGEALPWGTLVPIPSAPR